MEGSDPNALEKRLSAWEYEADRAFKRIIASRSIDNSEDRSLLLTLIARLSLSSPSFRKTRDQVMIQVAEGMMHNLVASKERWDETIQRMKADGIEIEAIPYEEMKAAVLNKDIVPVTAREELIRQEIGLWLEIMPLLEGRKWTLAVSDRHIGEFATSDRPVNLQWADDEDRGLFGPGLGSGQSLLTLPITKHLAVIGSFEQGGHIAPATQEFVAAFNLRTAATAMNQIYCSGDFSIRDTDGSIRSFSKSNLWLDRIRRAEAARDAKDVGRSNDDRP